MERLEKLKKILQLKKKLMNDSGKYFEDLADFEEPAKVCKAKNFVRSSKREYVKTYKKAMREINKLLPLNDACHHSQRSESPVDKTKEKEKASSTNETKIEGKQSPSTASK